MFWGKSAKYAHLTRIVSQFQKITYITLKCKLVQCFSWNLNTMRFKKTCFGLRVLRRNGDFEPPWLQPTTTIMLYMSCV